MEQRGVLTLPARSLRLVAEKLAGRRGGQLLFAGLDFTLHPGDALLVKGQNGSGKSTLLRMAAGLLPPAGGRIGLDGGNLSSHAHYLSTANAMKPTLTVGENLAFWRDFLVGNREDPAPPASAESLSVEAALEATALPHTVALPFAALSTGQRRRVALARLLIDFRPLWLLDEPASGLDDVAQAGLAALMRDHLAKGGMVMAAVHDDPGLEGARELRLGGPAGKAGS